MDIEIWLLDPDALILKRELFGGTEEEVMPIKGNVDVLELMCLHKEDYGTLLEAYQ